MAVDLSASGPRRSRPQLSEESASFVRELIMSGQLMPGEFIRQEQLAEDLGMSATPVREGLLSLRGEGFLRLEPRRGFVVAPLSSADVRDLFWAQALVAGELAARAVERVTDEDAAQLKALQDKLEQLSKRRSYDAMEHVNHLFHRHINQLADAPKMSWLLGVAARYVPRRFYATIKGWPDSSRQDHRSIISAIDNRDASAVREAMQRHMVHAGELLAQHREIIARGPANGKKKE